MSQRARQYPDPWTGVGSERDDEPLEHQRSYHGSPQSQAYSDFRYSPYPASSSRSSIHYSGQPYPPGYIGQERRLEQAPHSGRELPRNASRPLFGSDQQVENESFQPSFTQDYRPSPLDTTHGYVRQSSSFGYEESFPGTSLRRRPSSLQNYETFETHARISPTHSLWGTEYAHERPEDLSDHSIPLSKSHSRQAGESLQSLSRHGSSSQKPHHTQKRSNRDEFDGPTQYLPRPPSSTFTATESDLPTVPITLDVYEQDSVLTEVNKRLSQCAFNFIAKYNFPIPLETGKRRVESPSDREWTEWAHLLKRLATKRRIPARLLYEGQIKQMVTVLENSLEMRHASARLSRPLKDDWNVLQLISAGVQVAKLLKDSETMRVLEELYRTTETVISERKGKGKTSSPKGGNGGVKSASWGNRQVNRIGEGT